MSEMRILWYELDQLNSSETICVIHLYSSERIWTCPNVSERVQTCPNESKQIIHIQSKYVPT